MAFRAEFTEALGLLAVACDRMVGRAHKRPVIVGGAAVEFYTGSAVVSGDFDFVTDAQGAFEEILIELGFRREDRVGRLLRGLYHPDLEIGVEIVSGTLFEGASDPEKIVLVDVSEGCQVAIASAEDLIADRMGQFCASLNHRLDMLDQAVKLIALAETIDKEYLDRRIKAETLDEFDLAYLEAKVR